MLNASGTNLWEGFQQTDMQMQAMDMGSTEVALTQLSAIPPGNSSSYFLQLDPSGQVDILESSLVLNKPDMVDETVYEIQLDQYMMDERNLEVVNLQNAVTFQPQFLDEHQFPASFDTTTEVHYQLDDFSLNQLLLNNATVIPVTATPTELVREPGEEEIVPEFTVETEVATESDQVISQELNAIMPPGVSFNQDETNHTQSSSQSILCVPAEVSAEANVSTLTPPEDQEIESEVVSSEGLVEILKKTGEEESGAKEKSRVVWSEKKTRKKRSRKLIEKFVKRELPDKIMQFTEEAVIPPVVEIVPTPSTTTPPVSPPVVTIEEDDGNDDDDDSMDDGLPHVSRFLYDGIDKDDELYISYLSRPSLEKTDMCILCYEWFESKKYLEEHIKSAHEDNMKLYGCKRCGKKFWSRFLRQRHEKMHRYELKGPIQRYFPKNRPFDHYESKHFFKRLRPAPFTQDYREHIRSVHCQIKSTEFDCITCDKNFHTEEECREHYEEEHAVQTCVHCDKELGNSKLLRRHEQDVHGMYSVNKNYPGGAWELWKSWECDEIKEKDDLMFNVYFYHNYTKRVKTENTSGEETPVSTCSKFSEFACEEVTVSEYEAANNKEERVEVKTEKIKVKHVIVKKEKKSSNSETPKGRKTDHKPKIQDFDKIEFLEDLMIKDEPTDRRTDLPFKCGTCRTSFDNDIDLQRHVKSHTIRSMAYMCQYCGRGFATHSNRKEHERIHTGDKPYVCPSKLEFCSRAFVQISNLKKHIQTHKDKNNLQCSTCNKQFVKESSLILHQRAHSQDRKFRCHICDRAYNYASLLKRHMRIHTGENPYSCEDCGMQFHELVSLHYHRKKVHTGERPHRCDQCGRAFILSSDLKKHLKIHLRDGTNIKSSGSPASAKSKSGTSAGSVPSNSNGASTDSLMSFKDDESSEMMDDDFNNSSLIEFQHPIDESVEMPEPQDTGTEKILVISETDLLNVTTNGTKEDGVIQSESAVVAEPANDIRNFSNELLPC